MGAQRVRRAREPRGHRLPARPERGHARPRAGHDHGRRGVDGLAGGVAPDRRRRARLRPQVEHGLDARHARVLRARAGPPELPPRRAHLQPRLRVHRAVRAAALARRGRARQGLAAVAHAGRRLAAARQPARAVRATCGPTPARSCSSWAASWPRSRSGATSAASTGTCWSGPATPACSAWCATSTASTATAPRSGELDAEPAGFRWLVVDDRDANVVAFARFARDGATAGLRREPVAGAADELPARRCRARGAGGRC